MPVTYSFTLPDGSESKPTLEQMTEEQYGFLKLCEMGIGVPRLDRSTLDEFTRRADLMQAYVGPAVCGPHGEPRVLGRADFMKLMPGAGARTNWTPRSNREFDRLMKQEIDAYWASVDRREKEENG